MGLTGAAAAVSLAALAAAGGWAVYLPALTACGLTLGFVYAFTTVATQAVVRAERAGEAAGVTLTVGHARRRRRRGVRDRARDARARRQSTAAAIDTILGVLAALLLAASAVVLVIAGRPTESARSR